MVFINFNGVLIDEYRMWIDKLRKIWYYLVLMGVGIIGSIAFDYWLIPIAYKPFGMGRTIALGFINLIMIYFSFIVTKAGVMNSDWEKKWNWRAYAKRWYENQIQELKNYERLKGWWYSDNGVLEDAQLEILNLIEEAQEELDEEKIKRIKWKLNDKKKVVETDTNESV